MSIFTKIAGIFRKETKTTKEIPAVQVYPKPTTTPPPTNPFLPPLPPNPFFPAPPPSGGSGGGSSGGGTYYTNSGTYVSPEGVGMSTPNPPAGATISSGNNPQLPAPKVSSDVARVRANAQAAANIRAEAARRNVDISTPAREKGFLYNLKKEQSSGTYVKKKQQPFYDVNKKAYINEEGVGMSMPFDNVPIGTALMGNTAIFAYKNPPLPSQQSWGIKYLTQSPVEYKDVFKQEGKYGISQLKGGLELVKFAAFKPFQLTSEGLNQGGTYITSKVNPWVGGPLLIVSDIIPTSPAGAATFYGFSKAFTIVPKITRTVFTVEGIKKFTEASTPKEYEESALMFGIGAGGTILKGTRYTSAIFSKTKAVKVPYEYIEGTPLRERATVILKSENIFGQKNILYLEDKPTGTYMLPGGKIEIGETPLRAAKRELFEETGIKNIKLEYKGIETTAEQKHYIFEGKVKANELKIIQQQNEVQGFKWINPPKYSGASMFQPYGRKVSLIKQPGSYFWNDKIIRSEDLYIGSKSIYPNLKQTTLVIQRPSEVFLRRGQPTFLTKRVKSNDYISRLIGYKPGQFKKFQQAPGIVVGFGSRYDIPYSKLKQYSNKDLFYVSGTSGRIQTNLEVYKKGNEVKAIEGFRVEKKYMKRGEKVFYFQPPTSINKLKGESYLGATYLGLYRKQRSSYGMGVKFRNPNPSIYRYKGVLGKDLIATEKARRGTEFEVGKLPAQPNEDFSFITGKESKTYLAGRKVNIIELKNPERELTPREIKLIQKRMKELKLLERYEREGKRPKTSGEVLSEVSGKLIYSYKTPYETKTGYSYKTPYETKTGYSYKTPYGGKVPYSYKTGKYKEGINYNYKTDKYNYGGGGEGGDYTYTGGGYKNPPTKITYNIYSNKGLKKQTGLGKYFVSLRRFGKFKVIGITRTQKEAFTLGKFKTSRTLGATFKVSGRGVKQPQNIFGYRKKLSKKEGIVFIEQPKFRLSTPTEKSEIFSFRRQKGGRLF